MSFHVVHVLQRGAILSKEQGFIVCRVPDEMERKLPYGNRPRHHPEMESRRQPCSMTALRSDSPFVGVVPADEEPVDGAAVFDAQGAVGVVHADGPVAAHTLEVEGGMPVVFQPKGVLFAGEGLDVRGQAVEALPELRRDGGIH